MWAADGDELVSGQGRHLERPRCGGEVVVHGEDRHQRLLPELAVCQAFGLLQRSEGAQSQVHVAAVEGFGEPHRRLLGQVDLHLGVSLAEGAHQPW